MFGDLNGALEDLNKADQLRPNYAFTLQSRGATKLMLSDYQGALDDLNKADSIEPNHAFTLRQRAIVRYHLEDFSRALEDITQLLVQYPADKDSLKWKSQIEEKIKQQANKPNEVQSNNAVQLANDVSVVQEGVIRIPFDEFIILKTLSVGGYGEVSLAEWHGMNVALKKLKSNVVVDDESHEAKTLMQLRHKLIVLLMGITTDPTTNSTILVMEYMKHGSLEDLLFKQNVKLSRAEVIRIALDIEQGVNYLHSQTPKVLHRDLKSANVLLHRGKKRAKIADFGTAKFLHTDVQAKTVIGSFAIAMPPEMIAEENYDEKVDVFAFGVVLYEMFTNKRLPQLEENTRIKRIRDSINDAGLMKLALDCCASDPSTRPHMCQIVDSLRKMKNESI